MRNFLGSIERSRISILEESLSTIDLNYQNFSDHLATTSVQASSFAENSVKTKEELTQSLKVETLQFTGLDGLPCGVVSLGDRMKRFKKLVSNTEIEISRLRRELAEVQKSISNLGEDLLGPQISQWVAKYAATSDEARVNDDGKFKEITVEMEMTKARLKEKLENICARAIEKSQMIETVSQPKKVITYEKFSC